MAWKVFSTGARPDLRSPFDQFCHDQRHWLEDYALFRALKARQNGTYYLEWPAKLVQRDPAAMTLARGELANQIDMVRFAQFLLSRQGGRVKAYARSKGVRLFGDLPFFVAPDSSDVWTHPELFLLDEQQNPRFVAGVPPDYFSADGQLWGNPVYDWEAMRRTGYRWWIDRLAAWTGHVDLVRLDHFRAFAAAWHIPAGSPTARTGEWSSGPGADLFSMVESQLGALPFIAEDLGLITPDVHDLRDQFHLPGTRVLQFAFDGTSDNPHLPQNYEQNTAVYTGTHDNPPTRAWFEQLADQQKQNVSAYLGRSSLDSGEVTAALIESAWSSVAALAIAPLQDLLKLGAGAENNVPGNPEGNWRWRCTEDMLAGLDIQWLRSLTARSNRHLN
jgi:4-alpha-glucanotransferase